jgi:hypothetical protein
LVADDKKWLLVWESRLWMQKMAIFDAALGTECT